MSRVSKRLIQCPECGSKSEFEVWDSLNGDLDPDGKEKLLNGTLFVHECPSCGHMALVNYPILYNDMQHDTMVYYVVDDESKEEIMQAFKLLEADLPAGVPKCRKRIVHDQNSLREKAIIFENELDDRVVEILKVLYRSRLQQERPEVFVREAYFMIDEGHYSIQFMCEENLSADVSPELYNAVRDGYAEKLNAAGDEDYIVDLWWVTKFMEDNA